MHAFLKLMLPIVVLWSCFSSVQAQIGSPAIMDIKSCESNLKQAEKNMTDGWQNDPMKKRAVNNYLDYATKRIDVIHKKDPKYNTADLEKKLAQLKAQAGQSATATTNTPVKQPETKNELKPSGNQSGSSSSKRDPNSSPAMMEIKGVESNLRSARKKMEGDGWQNEPDNVYKAGVYIKNAENRIPFLVKADPNWDVAPYHEEIRSLRAQLESGNEAAQKREAVQKWLNQKVSYSNQLIVAKEEMYRWPNMEEADRVGKFDGYGAGTLKDKYFNQFNIAEVKAKMQEAISTYPDMANSWEIQKLNKFFDEDFPLYTKEILQWEIPHLLKEAEKEKTHSILASHRHVTTAQQIMDIVLAVTPDNAEFKALQPNIDAVRKDVDAYMEANIYTSPFHKAHLDQTVFSTSKLQIKSENRSAIKSSFTDGEYIYLTFYMGATLRTVLGSGPHLTFYVDGENVHTEYYSITDVPLEQTYYQIELIPNPATYENYHSFSITRLFAGLSPGKHTIRLEMDCRSENTGKNSISSSFEIDISNGTSAWKSYAEKMRVDLRSKIRLPKAAQSNAGIEADLKQVISEKGSVQRTVILNNDWNVVKHEYTKIPNYRSIYGAAAVKDSEGQCRLFVYSIRQYWDGQGYGKSQFGGFDVDRMPLNILGPNKKGVEMDCSNVYK